MNMKRTLLLVMTVMAFCGAWSQELHDPDTYYADAANKSGAQLKTALSDIISSHTTLGYKSLNDHYATTDTDADGYLIDIYSVKKKYKVTDTNTGTEGVGYNKEHTVPSSWFSKKSPMYSDIFHVLPTDSWVNSKRGNLPYGETSNPDGSSYNGFSKWGPCDSSIGFSGDIFEPNDEYKGDIARIYFYMATCYEDQLRTSTWSGGMFTANGFSSWAQTMLMRWAKEDPVSQKEIDRNKAVDMIQHNRNPFVDFPGLEEYIWGDKTTTPFDPLNYNGSSSETVARPVISPAGGKYTEPVSVSIACSTEGAAIYYTTDGTNPTTASTRYNAAFTLSETTTVKAFATLNGNSSAVTTATFTFTQGGQTEENIIWAEDWSSGSAGMKVEDVKNSVATYIGDGGQYEKLFDGTMSGGEAPELLIPKSSRSINYFIATITLGHASGEMHLTFNSGNNNLALTSTTSGVSISAGTYKDKVYSYTITVPEGTSTLALKFTTTSDNNTRVDNFMLTGDTQGGETELIPVTLAFSEDEAAATIGEDFTEPALTITPSNADIEVVYASDNETVATVDPATGEVTPHNEGVATIIASFDGDNTYMAAEDATYTLTVSLSGQPLINTGICEKITSVNDLEDGKNYLLVYEPGNVAYKMFNKDKGDVGEVVIDDHQIDMNNESNEAAVLVLEKSGDNWLIKDGDKYLALTSNSNSLNQQTNATDDGKWDITFDENGNAKINNLSRSAYFLQYNTSGLFRCYKNTQQNPMLYKEIMTSSEGVSLTIGSTGYASLYYGDVNLVVPEGVEATTYSVSNGKLMLTKTYAEGEIIPAGTAVVVYDGLTTTETYTFAETMEAGDAPETNMLKGFDDNATTVGDEEGTAYKFYMLAVDNETKDPASIGFYFGADDGAPFISKAHRAYLAVPAAAAKGMRAFEFKNVTGITAPAINTQTSDSSVYSLSGQRMNTRQLPKGVYIREGKKYVVK